VEEVSATMTTKRAGSTEAFAEVIGPVVAGLGLDLYDVEMIGAGASRTLRVSIDRAQGIDLEAITAATQAISPVLDREPTLAAALEGAYTLEVSSPGLERPLRTPDHFRRALDATISVKARRSGDQGATRVRGRLSSADDTGFDVEVEGAGERFAYDEVLQARTVFEWSAADQRGGRRGKQKVGS
jgi:ribosome maturation factor RimP